MPCRRVKKFAMDRCSAVAAVANEQELSNVNEIMEDTPIAEVPDIANWSENFALAVFDPIRNIHVFCHIGRWRKDMSLWRENVIIALPDGTTVFHRAIGNARASIKGPGGPCFAMQVEENFKTLRWSFLGGAIRVPAEVAQNSLPFDGPLERLEFDLVFHSDEEIWDIDLPAWVANKEVTDGPIVRGHTEQIGVLKGDIKIGDQVYHFEGMGNRDHSRGERLQKDEQRTHSWYHGVFENGISFLAYEVLNAPGEKPALSDACVYQGGKMYLGSWDQEFRFSPNGWDELQHKFSFSVKTDKHDLKIDITDIHHTNFIQFTAPWDLYVGRRQVDQDLNRCVPEQSASMLLNGTVKGYGHLERAMPGPIVFDPI